MEHITEWDRMQAVLSEHRGWSVMLWKFSPSLRRLVLRIYRFHETHELYVLCVGCKTIAGFFDWKGAELQLAQGVEPQGDTLYWIRDAGAGFALSCDSGFVLSAGTPGDEWLRNFEVNEDAPA